MRYAQGGGVSDERRQFREEIRMMAAERFALGEPSSSSVTETPRLKRKPTRPPWWDVVGRAVTDRISVGRVPDRHQRPQQHHAGDNGHQQRTQQPTPTRGPAHQPPQKGRHRGHRGRRHDETSEIGRGVYPDIAVVPSITQQHGRDESGPQENDPADGPAAGTVRRPLDLAQSLPYGVKWGNRGDPNVVGPPPASCLMPSQAPTE